MKKRLTLGQKMRFVAGGTFVVLALYQMLLTFYINQSMVSSDMNMAMRFSTYAIWLFAGVALWLFSSREALSDGARRGVAMGALLLVCYTLITYEVQRQIIRTALYNLIPMLYENQIAQYSFMLGKVLILILGGFFAWNSKQESPEKAAERAMLEAAAAEAAALVAAEAAAMPEGVVEETIVILSEPEDEDEE